MNTEPDPLDRREVDAAEDKSDSGDETRANTEYSCFPQNETSLDTNPLHRRTSSRERTTTGSAGPRPASTSPGTEARSGTTAGSRSRRCPTGTTSTAGGDPAIVFDRAGVVYYADINFNRTDDTNGVWVSRSTNGGFTWSRPCVVLTDTAPAAGLAIRASPATER